MERPWQREEGGKQGRLWNWSSGSFFTSWASCALKGESWALSEVLPRMVAFGCWPQLTAQAERQVTACSPQHAWVLGTVPFLTSCHTIILLSVLSWEPDAMSLQTLPGFRPCFLLFEFRSLCSNESSSVQCHKLGQWSHRSRLILKKWKVQGGKRNVCLHLLS